jgi:hypothetical protein
LDATEAAFFFAAFVAVDLAAEPAPSWRTWRAVATASDARLAVDAADAADAGIPDSVGAVVGGVLEMSPDLVASGDFNPPSGGGTGPTPVPNIPDMTAPASV